MIARKNEDTRYSVSVFSTTSPWLCSTTRLVHLHSSDLLSLAYVSRSLASVIGAQILATADDFGMVKLFDFPVTTPYAKHKKYLVRRLHAPDNTGAGRRMEGV